MRFFFLFDPLSERNLEKEVLGVGLIWNLQLLASRKMPRKEWCCYNCRPGFDLQSFSLPTACSHGLLCGSSQPSAMKAAGLLQVTLLVNKVKDQLFFNVWNPQLGWEAIELVLKVVLLLYWPWTSWVPGWCWLLLPSLIWKTTMLILIARSSILSAGLAQFTDLAQVLKLPL